MNAQWLTIREKLQKTLDSGIFEIWIAPLRGEVADGAVHLHASSVFEAKWLRERLAESIREAAAPVLGIDPGAVDLRIDVDSRPASAEPSADRRVAPAPSAQPVPRPANLPMKMPSPAPGRTMEWRYRFDDFVVGSSNSVAVAAAHDVSQRDGTVRTLFVNSSSGLGKTHLSQAVGKAIDEKGMGARITYLTAEEFASRFVASVMRKDVEAFKSRFLDTDVMILEDVHFFQGKAKTQEVALGVVKRLQSKGGRVIFTSSFSPRELKQVDSQLVSHFCSGILARMDRPSVEMRKEILQRKARGLNLHLTDAVCDVLATRLQGDVRQMESCIGSLAFRARHMESGVSVGLAMDVLSGYAGGDVATTLETIVRLVCEGFGVTEEDLRSRSRRQEYVHGRNTVYYLARRHTDHSLKEIGDIFNRKHSTVIKGITSLEQEISRDSTAGRRLASTLALVERNAGLTAIPPHPMK